MSIKEHESHFEEEETLAENPQDPGWKTFLKFCGLCCYVACPPVPELITRKLAFHPPKKGKNYTIRLKRNPERKVDSVNEVVGEEISIVPTPVKQFPPQHYQRMMDRVQAFVVEDARGNNIVGIKCSSNKFCEDNQQVIIFAQPNSADLGGFLHPFIFNFVEMSEMFECNVYAFDYSGYGYSTGSPSEQNIYANIDAIFNYVKEKNPNKKIILMGYSLGTAVMIYMASRNPPELSGVILLAPFTSGLRIFANNPDREKSNCLDRFKTVDRIKDVSVPVLIIHGTNDNVIPISHSQRLHSVLKHPVPPLFVYGADHQTIFSNSAFQTFRRIDRFLTLETFLMGERPTTPVEETKTIK